MDCFREKVFHLGTFEIHKICILLLDAGRRQIEEETNTNLGWCLSSQLRPSGKVWDRCLLWEYGNGMIDTSTGYKVNVKYTPREKLYPQCIKVKPPKKMSWAQSLFCENLATEGCPSDIYDPAKRLATQYYWQVRGKAWMKDHMFVILRQKLWRNF